MDVMVEVRAGGGLCLCEEVVGFAEVEELMVAAATEEAK